MTLNKDDHYCYCSDMLVHTEPAEAIEIIASGKNHSTWASSNKYEDKPGEWVGQSYFTGKEYIRLRFDIDQINQHVDYIIGTPEDSSAQLKLMTWARVVDAKKLGFEKAGSLIALYQPRFAGQDLDTFLRERFLHASEMYRIRDLAERGQGITADARPTGHYLATFSDVMPIPAETLFDFVSNPLRYGKWTWGRRERQQVSDNTYLCVLDTSETECLLRPEADRARMTVDYFAGQQDNMLLSQSVRIFDARVFGYEDNVSLVTFTRWRAFGQSDYEWDRDVLSQIIETKMTREKLVNGYDL